MGQPFLLRCMFVTLREVRGGDVGGAVQGANNSNNNSSSQAPRAPVVDVALAKALTALQLGGQVKAKKTEEKVSNEIVILLSVLAVAFVVGLAFTVVAGPKYLRVRILGNCLERVTLSRQTTHLEPTFTSLKNVSMAYVLSMFSSSPSPSLSMFSPHSHIF